MHTGRFRGPGDEGFYRREIVQTVPIPSGIPEEEEAEEQAAGALEPVVKPKAPRKYNVSHMLHPPPPPDASQCKHFITTPANTCWSDRI